MSKIRFLDLNKQYLSIREEIDEAIASIIHDSAYVGGKPLRDFEENFSNFLGADHCVGVGNGTDAIEIALEILKLPKNSEVIVPVNSFVATAEPVLRAGLKVVFCPVSPIDFNLDCELLPRYITERTSAIIPVHLYGCPANMKRIMSIAAKNNLKVIEDCAQAHGSAIDGKKVGTFGDLATFSFYPGKTLGAYGDGGAIISNDASLADQARKLANHGRESKFQHDIVGRNSRLDGLQAAVLNVKLEHLDKWIGKRNEVALTYQDMLGEHSDLLRFQQAGEGFFNSYHLFVIELLSDDRSKREKLQNALQEQGIQTGIHYPLSIAKLKAFEDHPQANENSFGWEHGSRLLSLPIGEHLESDDAREVTRALLHFFGR